MIAHDREIRVLNFLFFVFVYRLMLNVEFKIDFGAAKKYDS